MYFDQQSLIQKQLESLSRDDEYSPKKSSSSPPKRKYKPRVKKTPSPNKSPSKRKVTLNKKIDLNLQMLKAAENERIKKDTIIGELYVPIPSKDSEATDSEKTDEEIDDDHDSDAEHYIKTHFHALKNTSMYAQSRELAKETENLPAMVPAIIDGQLRCITEQEYLKTPIKNTDEVTEDEEDEELAYLKMKEIEMLKLHDKRQKEEAMIERQKKIKEQIIKNTEVQELKKTQKMVLSKKNVIDQNVGMKSPKAIKKVSETNNDVEGKENIKEVITPGSKKEDSIQSLQSKTINDLNKLIRRKTVETFDDEKVDSEIKKKLTDFGSSENNRDQPKLVMGMKRKVVDRAMPGIPDLKRTRSIDGAKLRSINFIMPLQKSMTQEVIKKEPVLNNKRKVTNENKVDSKSLLKLVTMTKKQPISKPKQVTPVTTQASSGQGDSEKWKNSWRSVLAENKTITVIRDVSKKMSYNEEKLMSVIQAGFLSLGSVISPELSDKTFILVIGSEESEVKSTKMKEIVNQAQKRGCKVWNLQKSRRFFKHLDIEVEEMENDYEMMRYIDYAKYKKPVPPKVVEQAITTENKPTAGPQPNKLNEYLTMESKIGNLDRDITARREDYHYFSEEKPHMYLYYKNQQFAPIVSMEWKCPTTEEDIFKEKYDLDALPYPTIKYSYNGRSPFAKRDKEEILYQRAFSLNNRGKEAINIVRHADPNQKTVTKKLIKHRYEKDLVKEDYALMIRRLYSESSVPNAENNVYFFDNYYDKETKQWVPFNNTLSKMYTDPEMYEEKKNLSMNMRKHNESFNTSENVTLQSPVCEKPMLMNVTQSPNKDGTTKYEDLENLSQRPLLQRVNTQHNSEMKASGVLVGTNMGTGTGNGLQPVKNSIISAQMKVLQKRQLVLQKQMALQKQQQKKEDGKSKNGYCEGCRVQYDDLEKHVKSERHVGYKNEEKNFSGIDELIRMISV